MALGFLLTVVGIAFTVLYLINYYVNPEEDKIEPTSTTLAAMTGTHLLHNITTTLVPTTIETTIPTDIKITKEAITVTEATEIITEPTTSEITTTSETTTLPEKIDTSTRTVRGQMASSTTPTLLPWMKGETRTGITMPDDYKDEP